MKSETTGAFDRTITRTRIGENPRKGLRGLVLFAAVWVRRFADLCSRIGVAISKTLNPAGWISAGIAVIGLSAGMAFGWVEWLTGGAIALLLLLLSLPFLFGSRALDIVLGVERERVVAGSGVAARVTITNLGKRPALPSWIDLPVGDGIMEVPVPLMRGRSSCETEVHISTPRRGLIKIGPAVAIRSDPIGLLSRKHQWQGVHQLYVHPRTLPIPAVTAGGVRDLEGNLTSKIVNADMSFHAIREYAPGDSRKQVHWKSTAKTGALMVRQYEETQRSRIAIALSISLPDYASTDEYELGVSAAASLCGQMVTDRRDLDLAIGVNIPRGGSGLPLTIQKVAAPTPVKLMDEFCRIDGVEAATPIESVCALQAEDASDLVLAFVVVGSQVALERVRKVAFEYGRNVSVVVVICDEQAKPSVRKLTDFTVLTVAVLEDLPALIAGGKQR